MVRPFFQSSPSMAKLYDVITWVFAILCLDYLVMPFVVYDVERSIQVRP